VLWREKLPDRYKKEIYAHIFNLKKHTTHSVPDENDLIDDRGSQITFSMYGHNAPHAEKNAFDPDFSYRKKVLSQAPFNSENIEVNITGSTCFDYTVKGRNKGFNIDRFIKYMNWRHSECLYFGDAIFPGGNDYTVVGIIDTVKVDSYRDTQKILKEKFT
jgi:hydroxymethylpyrimidine pyrophosphatase-like HAD family hydrolase